MSENKFKKLGSLTLHKNQTLFKVNIETLEIAPVTDSDFSTLPFKNKDGEVIKRKKIIVDKKFAYISALNKKNVRRKLNKMLLEQEK